MKKIILFIIVITSCEPRNYDNAIKEFENELIKGLSDPDSYEFVEFSLVDTIHGKTEEVLALESEIERQEELFEIAFSKAEAAVEVGDFEYFVRAAEEVDMVVRKMEELQYEHLGQVAADGLYGKTGPPIRYVANHSYRIKDASGFSELQQHLVVFDTNMNYLGSKKEFDKIKENEDELLNLKAGNLYLKMAKMQKDIDTHNWK